MPPDDHAKLFLRVDVLEPLSNGEVVDLARRTPVIRLERGQLLHTPHHAGGMLFFLLEGQVRLYRVVGGRELTLDLVEAGSMFGGPRAEGWSHEVYEGHYAEATKPSSIGLIRREAFERLVMSKPEVGLRVLRMLERFLYATTNRMADIALKEVPARLASVILYTVEREGVKSPEGFTIPTRYTHRQFAAMIGADRVAVTRAFNTLREAGAVELVRRRIYVKDIEVLMRIAREPHPPAGGERRAP